MVSLYLWGRSNQEMGGNVVIGHSIYGVVVIDGSLCSRFYSSPTSRLPIREEWYSLLTCWHVLHQLLGQWSGDFYHSAFALLQVPLTSLAKTDVKQPSVIYQSAKYGGCTCFCSTLSSKSKIAQICQGSGCHEQNYPYLILQGRYIRAFFPSCSTMPGLITGACLKFLAWTDYSLC